MSPFQSITGEKTRIDSKGNSEGSFTAYAFMKKTYTQMEKTYEYDCNSTLIQKNNLYKVECRSNHNRM